MEEVSLSHHEDNGQEGRNNPEGELYREQARILAIEG